MDSEIRKKALASLGDYMLSGDDALEAVQFLAERHNPWFTKTNTDQALQAVGRQFLSAEVLGLWLENYAFSGRRPLTVGVVSAGNIPLVAFHDILCVLVSGHRLLLKPSSKDDQLLLHLLEHLQRIEPSFRPYIEIADRLSGMDAVIATGSGNTTRYFEYYFRNIPHIIRSNRNSIAVLDGTESADALKALGHDVFDYFGLGCRSVSKLWLPEGYDVLQLSPGFAPFSHLMDHHAYRNNLDYNRTLLLMNSIPFADIDHLNITHNPMLASPISNLHYEFYKSLEEVKAAIAQEEAQIQCVAGNIESICDVKFGETQRPSIDDYADKVDTMAFIANLK